MNHIQSHRPKELRVVMCEVTLCRVEQFQLGTAGESRPTLAIGNPAIVFGDRGDGSSAVVAWRNVALPQERSVLCDPGSHGSARSSIVVGDTFPERCHRQYQSVSEPVSSSVDACRLN
jgi:hypothetical protein